MNRPWIKRRSTSRRDTLRRQNLVYEKVYKKKDWNNNVYTFPTEKHTWPNRPRRKIGQGQPNVMNYINNNGQESPKSSHQS